MFRTLSKVECFTKIVTAKKFLTIFTKHSILDVLNTLLESEIYFFAKKRCMVTIHQAFSSLTNLPGPNLDHLCIWQLDTASFFEHFDVKSLEKGLNKGS